MPRAASLPAPGSGELRVLLEAAEACARAAGALTLRHFGGLLEADRKPDGTPVTPADREAERLIRERVAQRFPDHGVLGEELGESNPGATVRWIVDPIDGTRSFMRGVPLFGVLIGIEVAGRVEVGVAHFPALRETVAAARGLGCRLNGSPARVSDTQRLADAVVLTTSLEWAVGREAGAFRELATRAAFSRTWGDCYGHALVATGRADVMVDPVLSAWDAGPLLVILTEAGGSFSDLRGTPTVHGGSGVSTNGILHDEVMGLLAPLA